MKVSVIIPNRNDTIMLGITVRSILEELRDISSEVIVVDNSDQDIWQVIKTSDFSPIAYAEKKTRVIRQDFPSMYAAMQTGMEVARGDYVMRSDSHVLHGRDVIRDCIKFMDETPQCGLGYVPIGWIDRPESWAKSELVYNKRGGIFGPWGGRATVPMKIPWHFGFKIANRRWFLDDCGGWGFFARNRLSWGGGEFYTAMKCWLVGKECWTIPTNPNYHIGPFNNRLAKVSNYHFRTYGSSGQQRQGIGILAAFYALGGKDYGYKDAELNRKSFEQYGLNLERDWPEAVRLVGEDLRWIEAHQKMTYEELLQRKPWYEERTVRNHTQDGASA